MSQELMEHVSRAISILQSYEEEIPRYEQRILAVGPKLKELEGIEVRIESARETLDQINQDLEKAKKDYAAFKSSLR